MALELYNTLSKQKELFVPINGKKVNLFVCGLTVYDYSHLGHAKTYTQFDLITRYLRYSGYDVFYLQNFTDIDDKIIDRAHATGIDWKDLTTKFENAYKEDMIALGNTSVTEYARATDHIPQIISQVEALMAKGFAYKTEDGIYFEVSKFAEYGKLSGRTNLKEDDSVSRIDEGGFKRGWNDFCLWKAEKPGEPVWESETLGRGRPGWHIEDTAITESYFGPQYDIHGGAVDLIFPHHDCEIAQMEAASGKVPLVKYWLHTAFLNINSEKMSKSKGNFKTIRDMLEVYNAKIVRFFIVSAHYRTSIDFSTDGLDQAKNTLERIQNFIANIDPSLDDTGNETMVGEVRKKIITALDDDFNTPQAFAHLFDFIREQNIRGGNGKQVLELFIELNKIFGDVFDLSKTMITELPQEILNLITRRDEARINKNWNLSDELRTEIEKLGYEVKDTPNGTQVVRK